MAGVPILDDEPLSAEQAACGFAVDLPCPKFRAPKVGDQDVRRTDLLGRLERERARPLILLTAPAGYGKTTLLAQWAAESDRPFAWVTIDEDDGDPKMLADSIAEALDTTGVGPGRSRRFVLVLDDAHLVPSDVLNEAVLGMLSCLPEGSQLAIASRCQPAPALGLIRAQRMVLELHAEDLAMSVAEAASLLANVGPDLEPSSVRHLAARTEGWPAALELAVSSGAPAPMPAEHRGQVSGDDHLISEYFRAEVLAALTPAAVRFLMRSSVLDRLSGPLCDEVLGRTRSAIVLADLARANVPLAPVDASHEWYRLHSLFREMLETELRRAEPELQPVLHRRAADWYRTVGDVDRAIDHDRSAGELARVGKQLWANLPGYLSTGRNHLVQRWLGGITADQAVGLPELALASAHSHLSFGRVAVAEQWTRTAGVSLSALSEETTRTERAGVLIIEAWAARGGATAMDEQAARAYDLLPDDSPWRATCCFLAGTAALLIGDDAGAERLLEEGAGRGALLARDAASLCLAQLAVLAGERNQTDAASDLARRARSVVEDQGLDSCPTSALVFAVCAAAAMREGLVDEAKAAAARCLLLLAALEDSVAWYGAEARILLARVSLSLGDVAGARQLLADASRLARRVRDVVVFGAWFDDAWNQFDVRAETALPGAATLTTAELRVLRFLPTHYSFHEIAQRLHVSSNTVKTHVHAVYRKLDASCRSEAVARATDAGLLGG